MVEKEKEKVQHAADGGVDPAKVRADERNREKVRADERQEAKVLRQKAKVLHLSHSEHSSKADVNEPSADQQRQSGN